MVKHKFYHKYVRRRSKFSSHDENNACQIGDKVLITESRPLSRSKKWRVSKIVQKAI
ncbi:MAG: 30S ribosomal protein S17 [Desulfobacterales bacterium]|nr:30S ribosomal protein S17 [Desulfobacterales bacterium]